MPFSCARLRKLLHSLVTLIKSRRASSSILLLPQDVPVRTKHLLHCCLLFAIVLLFQTELAWSGADSQEPDIDPVQSYGRLLTLLLYLIRLLALLSLPQVCFNFLGLTLFNAFQEKVALKSPASIAPFICVRTVTRGDFPELVCRNVQRNLVTCMSVGLENFILEVVTDKAITSLPVHHRIRQVIVPPDYQTRSGARFKARALQYCLEDDNNLLGDKDWIVHLDEETILTADVVRGIVNFVSRGKHEFGQGLVTYANEEIVNWLTTLADSFRVSDDMGKIRMQMRVFHRPLFGMKGSFVVSRFTAERDVSFDNGLDGSVAEDCFFSMMAYDKGYTFDFIEGAMWEKSPFTIRDFVQQRKRWLQGILLVVHSPRVPLSIKVFLGLSLYSWITVPLSTSNILLIRLFPLPTSSYVLFNSLFAFVAAVNIYMYIFGVLKSFSPHRMGLPRFILCVAGALLTIPFNVVIENIAVIWGVLGEKHKFYVVDKKISSSSSTGGSADTVGGGDCLSPSGSSLVNDKRLVDVADIV